MRNFYIFLLLLTIPQTFYGQSYCEDANSDLIYAYSHVKSAYNSNNISHLKYYAKRSLKAFERAKEKLTKCGCETAYNLAYDGSELLAKVDITKTYEDGRFYVKRAREIGKQSVIELDKCTIPIDENEELTTLQIEQSKLKQQQKELKLKEAEIKLKLAKQQEKELLIKKEQLIKSYNSVMSSNIETYNKALEICDCDHEAFSNNIENQKEVKSKSIEEIKTYFINNLKGLTVNYLSQLNLCDE